MFGGAGSFQELLSKAQEGLPSLSKYTETQVTVRDVQMHFDGMPAVKAWRLSEHLRASLGPVIMGFMRMLEKVPSGGDGGAVQTPEMMGAVIGGLQALPSKVIEHVAKEVTPYIRFSLDGNATRKVGTLEGFDATFQHVPAGARWLAIYECLFRALAVNLIPPFQSSDTSPSE